MNILNLIYKPDIKPDIKIYTQKPINHINIDPVVIYNHNKCLDYSISRVTGWPDTHTQSSNLCVRPSGHKNHIKPDIRHII